MGEKQREKQRLEIEIRNLNNQHIIRYFLRMIDELRRRGVIK